jgi:hypothetical protein
LFKERLIPLSFNYEISKELLITFRILKSGFMDILIFKTDIASRWHVRVLEQLFSPLQGIVKYSVDIEDVDHVLRVVSQSVKAPQVQHVLAQAGYFCEEMTD